MDLIESIFKKKMADLNAEYFEAKTELFIEALAPKSIQDIHHEYEDWIHGVQHRMISVDNFFVFLKLLLFALLLLYET